MYFFSAFELFILKHQTPQVDVAETLVHNEDASTVSLVNCHKEAHYYRKQLPQTVFLKQQMTTINAMQLFKALVNTLCTEASEVLGEGREAQPEWRGISLSFPFNCLVEYL